MIVYKIRRKSDGLYSTGGMGPRFTKKGKTWSTLGQLKNHLNQFIYEDYAKDVIGINRWFSYRDCELVQFEIVETETGTDDLRDLINKQLDKAAERSYHKTRKVVHI